jgi:predicted nucleic acid-binding protein
VNYLLDTNACIAFLKNHPLITSKIEEKKLSNLLLCAPVLVTHNVKEFVRVPGILLEDWQVE